jgi:peptide/nickel transport system substrate-binding protein
VGTGPFKLVEYKRDNYTKWVRNENYWQKGKPYLDGITVRYIPDAVTASAMMQAKEADMWYSAPVRDVANLEKQGFLSQRYGMPRMIFFNTKDPESKFQNKKVREAVEYGLDKGAMAKALGFGYYTPLTQVAPPGHWGYDPQLRGRTYDPVKAKQLLKEAGYPNGIKVKVLAMTAPPSPDEVQAIKRYLDEVGITIDPDLADTGRFFSSFWLKGWQDMALSNSSLSANYLTTFHRFFGPDPMANMASFKRPPELIALAEKSLTLTNQNDQKEITKQLVKMMFDEALAVPLYLVPTSIVHQPWVHVNWLKIQLVTRYTGEEWIDKH